MKLDKHKTRTNNMQQKLSKVDKTARIHRHYGTEFLRLWTNLKFVGRIGLVLGFYQKAIMSETIPDSLTTPLLETRNSIRDQIGCAIAKHQSSHVQSISFWVKLIPIARKYSTLKSLNRKRAKWDISLPHDSLVSGNTTPKILTSMIEARETDLSHLYNKLEKLTIQSTRDDTVSPLLYISGMSYRKIPSGYGVRTQSILAGLKASGIETHLRNIAFNQTDAKTDKNFIASLGNNASLTTMFDATVDYIAIQAQNTRAGTLASGSNWMAGLCTLRAARRLRKPFIYDVRGLWPMTRAAIDPGYAKQPGYAVQMKFEWAIMRAADAVMVISGPLKDLAIKNGVNPNKISVVPNMTAEVLKIPITMPQQSEIWTLGHAGSLTPYEGLDLILHLLYRYREINGKLVHFWIAGTGTYKTKLEELVKELELSKQVHFLGRVSRNTVLQRILASDVMVYPRQNSEVFQLIPALKPVEAMQMGTLTLMSNLAPHVELSRAGRARLATAPNPNKFDDTAVLNDWYEALTSLLAMSPIEKTEMRSQAQDWCRIHRSSQKVLQPWLEQFSRSLL